MENYNSTENQEIKGKFVKREVLTCFSYEMDAILNASANVAKGLPSYDEIDNLYEYKCPLCGDGFQNQDDFDGEEYPKGHENEGYPCYKCPSCNKELNSPPESEQQEIFEWWIVTEYLYNKLKEKGQPVLEWGNNCYWGRCTSGQAILLDHVISEICAEMEILDGQQYAWNK